MKEKSIVYFSADWCPSCKRTKPVVEEINRDIFPGMFQMIDVDVEREMAITFQISSIPTFVLFEDGCEINRMMGNQTKQSLIDFINNG
jgi:thioredoxin 1